MTSIPKIYRLGERFTQGIFDGPVVIEEKIDGSQFSFGITFDGELKCRSKSTIINQADPGMFRPAVELVKGLFFGGCLEPLWHYHCEFLAKPKHNVLAYSRVPKNYLVLFDVKFPNFYASVALKHEIADKLGLERVPVLYEGCLSEVISTLGWPIAVPFIEGLLDKDSVLGGQRIEGVVIKNYCKQHGDTQQPGAPPMTAKVVSDQFKERMTRVPRVIKNKGESELQFIIATLRTEARWVKAVGHLRDARILTDTARDIGLLLKELHQDLEAEEQDWIKQQLYDAFIKQIKHGVAKGFPEWYQKILAAGGLSVYQQEVQS